MTDIDEFLEFTPYFCDKKEIQLCKKGQIRSAWPPWRSGREIPVWVIDYRKPLVKDIEAKIFTLASVARGENLRRRHLNQDWTIFLKLQDM